MATTAGVGRKALSRREAPKRRSAWLRPETRTAWLFLLPSFIGFMVFYAIPAVRGIYLSFTDWDLLKQSGDWVGIDNYKAMFQDALFWNALGQTFKYVVINIGIQTVLALAIAVLMHRLTRSVVVRGILVLPWLIPNVVLALLWMWMLDPNLGVVNHWLTAVGFSEPGLPRQREPGDPHPRRDQHLAPHGLHRAAAVRRPGDDPADLLRGGRA